MTENVAEKQGNDTVLIEKVAIKATNQNLQPTEADWKEVRGSDSYDPKKEMSETRKVGVAAVDEYPTDSEAGADVHPDTNKDIQ